MHRLARSAPPYPASPAAILRRRRWLRAGVFSIIALLIGSILLGYLHGSRDDWAAFDRQQVHVARVVSGDRFTIEPGSREIIVQLAGVAAPQTGDYAAEMSRAWLVMHAEGKDVTLRLEPTQTRTAEGALLAYVYLSTTENVNIDAVKQGAAYADPRTPHSLSKQFEQAEAEARKKHIGLWKGVTDDTLPAWRKEWLAHLRQQRAGRHASTQPTTKRAPKEKAHP